MPSQPSAFLNAPDSNAYRPAPTPITQTQEVRVPYVASPREVPTLSVSIDNRCVLSRALLAAIPGFKNGCPVLLVVPAYRGGQWYLDTNPKPGTGQRLPENPAARPVFRVPPVGKHHFTQSAVQQATTEGKRRRLIVANKNTQATLLRFRLGAQVPGHPGYYELVAIPNGGVNQ